MRVAGGRGRADRGGNPADRARGKSIMASQGSESFLGRFRVKTKLASVPAALILAIAVMLAYTIVTLEGQKTDSVVVDMIARQRMLNQRYLKELLLASQGAETEMAYTRKVLDETL